MKTNSLASYTERKREKLNRYRVMTESSGRGKQMSTKKYGGMGWGRGEGGGGGAKLSHVIFTTPHPITYPAIPAPP